MHKDVSFTALCHLQSSLSSYAVSLIFNSLVSIYDQRGRCLPCPNTARYCWNEQRGGRNPLRWIPDNLSAFGLHCLFPYYHCTTKELGLYWSVTLYKMLKPQTTWRCGVLALFAWRKQAGAVLAVLPNFLSNKPSSHSVYHFFYPCMHGADIKAFFHLLWQRQDNSVFPCLLSAKSETADKCPCSTDTSHCASNSFCVKVSLWQGETKVVQPFIGTDTSQPCPREDVKRWWKLYIQNKNASSLKEWLIWTELSLFQLE